MFLDTLNTGVEVVGFCGPVAFVFDEPIEFLFRLVFTEFDLISVECNVNKFS